MYNNTKGQVLMLVAGLRAPPCWNNVEVCREWRCHVCYSVFCRQNNTIVDTVLAAPRASYPDIVKLTNKQVQAGTFASMKVVPGYYTVATDRGGWPTVDDCSQLALAFMDGKAW